MHIAVIGSSYVGLVTSVCLAEIGHQVIEVDSDTTKITALTRGETPIFPENPPIFGPKRWPVSDAVERASAGTKLSRNRVLRQAFS